ncbi:MAG: Gfo/Idh/MocA family oxidoreductase [Terriglobales bacterium]|jgi:predicted dehydrogenase
MTDRIRLAILGCGAITRSEHLPAVKAHPEVELVALVDTDTSRANALIQSRGLACKAVADYRELFGQVDAVINALPNHLHVGSNMDCLGAGVHVLCEKPLAITAAEARSCTEFAEQKKLVLAVGMNRRFAASHPLLKLVIAEGLLGTLQSYDFQYGGAFDWRSASGFYFDRAKAGGGALVDFGVHMLDSVIDWFGPVTAFDYQDDDWGSGIEANLFLDVKHAGKFGDVPGHLRLSRTFQLPNRLLVRGSAASAEISVQDPEVVVIHREIGGVPVSQTLRLENFAGASSYWRQLDNFVQSVRSHAKPEVDGWQAVRVLELIENCYANKRRIAEPWSEADSEPGSVEDRKASASTTNGARP